MLELAFRQYRANQYAEAEQTLVRARRVAPVDQDLLLLLATVLQAQDRAREALELLLASRAAEGQSFELEVGLARAARAAGEQEIALEAYRRALALRPDVPELYVALASSCEALKREEEAIAAYRDALRLSPGYPGVRLNLGHLLQKHGELAEARSHFEAELQSTPRSVKALFNLGVVQDQLGNPDAAEQYFRQALQLDPHFGEAHASLGTLLSRRGDYTGAISHFERSGSAGLQAMHFNIAISLAHEGRIAEAREHFVRAATIPADDLGSHNDIGIMFFIHGCLDEARPLIEHAAAHAPSSPLMQFNLALLQLATEPSVEAWGQYTWRFHPALGAAIAREYPFPQWQGEPLNGRSLLVWGEQGVGDEMLFAGMYPQLEHCGARVVFECKPKLVSLFQRSFPWARALERRTPPLAEVQSGFDYQIAAGSLARFLRPTRESFPQHAGGYLVADESRAAYWRERLAALGPGLKIGFCWRSSNMKGDRALSCAKLEEWADLFAVPGVHWVCLQYGDCEAELVAARERFRVPLHRFDDVSYFDDLDEVAALMKGLDLIISAPTTVSVQAAALGIPTWQMSYGVDWQTHGTDRNLWFPAMTRFQRSWHQSWPEVLGGMAARLRALVDRTQ